MNNNERMRYFWAIAIPASIFAVTIILMAGSKCAIPSADSYGERCGNPMSNILYDYQGLIAGAFAIYAAYITVKTMRLTDDRQELRHQELMRLNLKRDQLIARRAAHPQVLDIAECERDLEQIEAQLRSIGYAACIREWGANMHNPLNPICVNLTDILSRDQLGAVKKLLDHGGYRAFQLLENELNELVTASQTAAIDATQYEAHKVPISYAVTKGQNLLNQLTVTRHRLHQLNESIVSLAADYD